MSSADFVESSSPATAYCSVRNCTAGFVHTQDAGLGPRRPATSINAGSSALVDVFHFAGSTTTSAPLAGMVIAGAVVAGPVVVGTVVAGTVVVGPETAGIGGFGAGASEQQASDARTMIEEARSVCMGLVA